MTASCVYFAQAIDGGPIKIGVTTNVTTRLAALSTASAHELRLLASAPGSQRHESQLHARFAAARLRAEWFLASPDLLALIERVKATGSLDMEAAPGEAVRIRVVGIAGYLPLRQQLLVLARQYAAQLDISVARVATLVHDQGAFFRYLEEGKDCTVGTYEKALGWFHQNWPAGAAWPQGVLKPDIEEETGADIRATEPAQTQAA